MQEEEQRQAARALAQAYLEDLLQQPTLPACRAPVLRALLAAGPEEGIPCTLKVGRW